MQRRKTFAISSFLVSSAFGIMLMVTLFQFALLTPALAQADEFSIDTTELSMVAGYEDAEEYIYVNAGEAVSFTSSNSSIVKVSFDKDSPYECALTAVNVGTAVITAKGTDGTEAKCTVTVTAPPVKLNKSKIVFNTYDGYIDYETLFSLDEVALTKCVSSDTSVVRVKKGYDDFEVMPIAQGNATITAYNKFGSKRTVPITVTKRWSDEEKYYYDYEEICIYSIVYGESIEREGGTTLLKVQATANGKTYKAKAKKSYGFYDYKIKLPLLKIGTKVKMTYTCGEACFTDTVEVTNNKPSIKLKATTKKVKGYIANLHKGDKVTIKYGKKAYTKKVKKNTSKFKVNQKLSKAKKGKKVTIKVYNKFKQKLNTKTIKVK